MVWSSIRQLLFTLDFKAMFVHHQSLLPKHAWVQTVWKIHHRLQKHWLCLRITLSYKAANPFWLFILCERSFYLKFLCTSSQLFLGLVKSSSQSRKKTPPFCKFSWNRFFKKSVTVNISPTDLTETLISKLDSSTISVIL